MDTSVDHPRVHEAQRSIDDLVAEAHRYRASRQYRDLVEFMAGFRRLKPFNALLIHIQRPGARFVAPAHRWRDRYDRRVRPGETPLVALQPFGPVMFVYDVSQTEPLGRASGPDVFASSFAMPPMTGVDAALSRLLANAAADGVRVARGAAGSLLAGHIRPAPGGSSQRVVVDRRTGRSADVPVRYEVVINRDLAPTETFATLAHELAHLYCGHVGTPDPAWWPERTHLPLGVREFEAETVAYLACRHVDEAARMPAYLDSYLDEHAAVPEGISLDVVTKAAGTLIELTRTWLRPRPPVPRSGRAAP